MNSAIAKERFGDVVKVNSAESTRDDLFITHVGMNKLQVLDKFQYQPEEKDGFRSEDDIYENIIKNPNNTHQFIVVYGQSGTGKSHLIRWFKERFEFEKPENEVVLYIRRIDNTLKGTIGQLLDMPEVKMIEKKEIFQRLSRASEAVPEDKLKDMIYHNFLVEIEHDDEDHEYKLSRVLRKKLSAFLNNDSIHEHMMEEGGPIERIYSKVAPDSAIENLDIIAEFKPKDFYVDTDLKDKLIDADRKAQGMANILMSDVKGPDMAQDIANYLNQFLDIVIQRCAGIESGDFHQLFLDIGRELKKQGKNLTIFIEDITSFTGVDKALLNVLIEDNSSEGMCRISSVVGGTNGYINNNFLDNHKDRVSKYIYIPDNEFDRDGLLEFVAKYLNAMSLPKETVQRWVTEDSASESGYPIHDITEGKEWEFFTLKHKQKLPLYPFTVHSIKYLYDNQLKDGHRTPRYILRDIIEPVVSDILMHKHTFPTINFPIVGGGTIQKIIPRQIKDQELQDRIIRFTTVWGNGKAEEYREGGELYISGIKENIYQELDMPIPHFIIIPPPPIGPDIETNVDGNGGNNGYDEEKEDPKIHEANERLTHWVNGDALDLSNNRGVMGVIRSAMNDLNDFLFDTIDWQGSGISKDNIEKIRISTKGKSARHKLVTLGNTTKESNAYYVLEATWDSVNVLMAFVKWKILGKGSWNYTHSDEDVYLVTSWMYKVKSTLIEAVQLVNNGSKSQYINAAIIAEIYRMILSGEYTGKTFNGLRRDYFFTENKGINSSFHSKEWNALLSLMGGEEAKGIRETIQRYFRLYQGAFRKSGVITLDDYNLEKTLKVITKEKLKISDGDWQANDKIKLRADIYKYLSEIISRVDTVAQKEVEYAKAKMNIIEACFEDTQIDSEDIEDLVEKAKEFKKEINDAHINSKVYISDDVKKKSRSIAKAIYEVFSLIEETDTLKILMGFSSNPLEKINPLVIFIKELNNSIVITKGKIEGRIPKSPDGPDDPIAPLNEHYKEELDTINNDRILLEGWKHDI